MLLTDVQFSEDSKLEIICDDSFSCSTLTKIKIPSNVTIIDDWSFSDCDLKFVEFDENSKLKSIYLIISIQKLL